MIVAHPGDRLKNMLNLSVTVGQVLAGIGTTASVTAIVILWATAHFQTKVDAADYKSEINGRLNKMEHNFQEQNKLSTQIAIDVSYIKGRLEPNQKTK